MKVKSHIWRGGNDAYRIVSDSILIRNHGDRRISNGY